MSGFTFKKRERLTLRSHIDALFRDGRVMYSGPLKVIYGFEKNAYPVKILVTVPRKKFRKAVDRNRIKRLMREAYRTNRYLLFRECPELQVSLHAGFIYTGEQKDIGFSEIEKHIIRILNHLAAEISSTCSSKDPY